MFKTLAKTLIISALYLSLPSQAEMTTEPAQIQIDINQADLDELDKHLEGIGKTKAKKIIEYRELHGDFEAIEDLMKIKGIGHVLVERNRDKIKL